MSSQWYASVDGQEILFHSSCPAGQINSTKADYLVCFGIGLIKTHLAIAENLLIFLAAGETTSRRNHGKREQQRTRKKKYRIKIKPKNFCFSLSLFFPCCPAVVREKHTCAHPAQSGVANRLTASLVHDRMAPFVHQQRPCGWISIFMHPITLRKSILVIDVLLKKKKIYPK